MDTSISISLSHTQMHIFLFLWGHGTYTVDKTIHETLYMTHLLILNPVLTATLKQCIVQDTHLWPSLLLDSQPQ